MSLVSSSSVVANACRSGRSTGDVDVCRPGLRLQFARQRTQFSLRHRDKGSISFFSSSVFQLQARKNLTVHPAGTSQPASQRHQRRQQAPPRGASTLCHLATPNSLPYGAAPPHSHPSFCPRSDVLGSVQPRHTSGTPRAALAGTESSGEEEKVQSDLSLLERVSAFQQAFWKFLRPHTIRGTVLGTTAVVAKALIENSHAINWALTPRALRGLLALLCGNGYIVGINQIYDTEIDKVNKPFLPVASGELSAAQAAFLCTALALGGVSIVATNFGPLITGLYSLGLLLGTLYSVPPLRLKRFPLPAFLIIATVRGLLLNFGVYYATRAALGLPFAWSPSILFITIFVTVFATVIAITKDLPDVEGDRKFNVETFATKLGVRTITFAGSGLLLLNYVAAIVAALRLPTAFRAPLMVSAHAVLGLSLLFQTWKLDAAKYSQEAIAAFYRFIWNLFYLEYALLPFI